MDITRKHIIHAVIVFVVLWLGSLVVPQFYHFSNLGSVFLVTAAYMALYFVFNIGFSAIVAKMGDFSTSMTGFVLFMLVDFVPGAIALYLMANWYPGFWAYTPWLIAIILSVICESLHLVGAFIQER